MILSCLYLGCGGAKEQTATPQASSTQKTEQAPSEESGKTIVSSDGVSSVSVVGGWQQATGLHKKAQLQLKNPIRDLYFVVFSEKKENYADVSLEEHAKITREHLLETLQSPTMSAPVKLTINGNPAIQHEIRGFAGNVKIVYLHTDVEGPYYYHEIVAWTLDKSFHQNKYGLQNLINSFKELEPKTQQAS
jgi:hypothetical protein